MPPCLGGILVDFLTVMLYYVSIEQVRLKIILRY